MELISNNASIEDLGETALPAAHFFQPPTGPGLIHIQQTNVRGRRVQHHRCTRVTVSSENKQL